MKNSIPTSLTCAALGLASFLHADTFTYQNGVSPTGSYTGNEARMTTSFGSGTGTTEQIGGSLAGGTGRFISPVRFNNLSSAAGWNNPNHVGFDVTSITLTLTVDTNTLNGAGTLALVFNNRGANSDWVEGQVNQVVKSTGNGWAGPSGTLTNVGSGAPFAAGGQGWDIGAANNGLPILATADVDASTTGTVTFTIDSSTLTSAEMVELVQIWSHDYGSGSLTVSGQTYTANPGLFLSFSATDTYSTGDIRFFDDDNATAANRPQLVIESFPGTPPSIPADPSGLTVGSASDSSLTLSWTDNSSDESGFKIERSPDGSTGWTLIHTATADATSYTNAGLSASTTYYYRVAATNGIGDSAYTSTASGTTLAASPVIYEGFDYTDESALPLAGGAAGGTGWSTTTGQDGWRRTDNNNTIFNYRTDTDFTIASPTNYGFTNIGGVAKPNQSGGNLIAYRNLATAINLGAAGTQYFSFQYRRQNGQNAEFGLRNSTGGYVFQFYARGGNDTRVSSAYAANAFTGAWTDATDYTVILRLTTNGSGGGTLDQLRYTSSQSIPLTEPGTWTTVFSSMTGMGSASGTNITMWLEDDDHTTPSHLMDNIRLGGTWTSVALSAGGSTPAAPSALAVATVSSSTQLSLSWTDNASDETGFKVERSPDGSTGWTQIAALAANAVGYTNTGLTPGTPYFYRVIATNGSGDSTASNTASATTWTYSQAWFNSFSLPIGTSLGADGDNDGLNNALEFVLGGNPTTNDTPSVRPTVTAAGSDLVLTFKRSDESEGQPISVKVQTSTNLSGWSDFATIGATNGSGYTVTENSAAPDTIVVTIPKGADTKKFARVVANY